MTVTVTGTDDAPVITTADPQVGITEQDLTTGSATADTASGSLAFTDVDLSETGHTAAVTQVEEEDERGDGREAAADAAVVPRRPRTG